MQPMHACSYGQANQGYKGYKMREWRYELIMQSNAHACSYTGKLIIREGVKRTREIQWRYELINYTPMHAATVESGTAGMEIINQSNAHACSYGRKREWRYELINRTNAHACSYGQARPGKLIIRGRGKTVKGAGMEILINQSNAHACSYTGRKGPAS